MKKWILEFLDSPEILSIRIVACFTICFFMIGFVALSAASSQYQEKQVEEKVATEQRFTKLEDAVSNLQENQKEQRIYSWLQILGLSGLIGETGIRVMKKRMP